MRQPQAGELPVSFAEWLVQRFRRSLRPEEEESPAGRPLCSRAPCFTAASRDDERVISVLIVDDEALVRSGLSLILDAGEGVEVVAAVTGVSAITAVREFRPDVVLLDVQMRDIDGLQVLHALRAEPDPPIVAMLTTFDRDDLLSAALMGGAAGFLLKNIDPAALVSMVHVLACGGTVLAPGVGRACLAAASVDFDARARVESLRPREREVLRLMAEGSTNRAIAKSLTMSLGAVKDDVSAVLTALGAPNRVRAALVAARAGLVTS
ncbi:DNA-binding response regulator [Rathayibacter sp. AY1A3]|nr:DNA-binding response regulator [Rathayibacter sp. AY1A3]